ncbi:sodium channel protein Nach-like [Aricia agestis]|uniref:sodium channel protein Nach-like n=1 Tax=Aricia agestis TaxID=91739 RepID=UPI001C204C90|nr:sodium channel protein Nach-like [Aricia agestis]
MEKVVNLHIRDTYLTKKPQHERQHAYQKGKSTETALMDLVDRIDRAIEDKEIALCVFLDIEGVKTRKFLQFDQKSYPVKNLKDFRRTSKLKLISAQKRQSKDSFFKRAKDYFVLFLETSSIHGLNHLVAVGRHPFEVLLWLVTVAVSLFGTIYLSRATWIRYQNSPTVISMDRDMFAWNTSFPAVTLCLDMKVDSDKLNQMLRTTNETDKDLLSNFVRSLANATFENFNQIPEYEGIPPEKYIDVLLSLTPNFKPVLTIGASGINLQVIPTVTEMGICYAINSKVAIYSSPEYIKADRWDPVHITDEDIFYVHPLDGEVFAQVIKIPSAYDAYIHGPLEVPDISTRFQYSEEEFYLKLYVTAVAVYTTPEAARLTVGQRRCRFIHENNLPHFSVYTYTMCRMECRIRLCLQYCQCIPFFYRKREDEKTCDVKGMHCLAKYKDELKNLRDNAGKKLDCDCFPICDDVNYVIQLNPLQEWFMGTNFQWGMSTYPRLRYRRDIIFGFTDVLVAVGGMAGLFLGCSVLSFLEIVYFLTLHLFFHSFTKYKGRN